MRTARMIGALSSLGLPIGAYIAHKVPDETGWYRRWFIAGAAILSVAAIFFSIPAAWPIAMIGSGAYILGLATARDWLSALGIAVTVLAGSLVSYELVFASLLFAAGYRWSVGARKELAWYALMPTVIILASLL